VRKAESGDGIKYMSVRSNAQSIQNTDREDLYENTNIKTGSSIKNI